jgi:hypothetical protein
MKNNIYKIKLSFVITLICGFLSSCGDLKLQELNTFQPGIPELATFKDQTAWEWMQTQTTAVGATVLANNKLDNMITLIKVAGLEEEYNKAIKDRTYLFLPNSAFTGTGRINALLTGVSAGTGDLTKVDKVRAANLLKYHIINAYVQQNSLLLYGVNYDYQSLLDGPNGLMKLQRTTRFQISINNSADLPSTRRTAAVTLHNYQFKNGIAHFIGTHVGITPF